MRVTGDNGVHIWHGEDGDLWKCSKCLQISENSVTLFR